MRTAMIMNIDHLFNPRLCVVFALAMLSGCASVHPDLGRSDVDSLLSERGQSVETNTQTLLDTLTAAPLSSESVVRISLMNNPRLQSTYAMLGFGAADVYEAGRIRNPIFIAAAERDQVTLGLVTSFTDLITLRARKRLSSGAFAALKQSVGAEVMTVAAEAERAYYHYVGAQQVATLRAQIAKVGALSAALAERFRDAGNLTPRELALERATASAARLAALEADATAFEARTELAAMLGLSVGDTWNAPASLRLPLDTEDDLNALLALAKDARLDLVAARTRADVLADQLGVLNWTRWLGERDVGLLGMPNAGKSTLITSMSRANTDLKIAINEVRETVIAVDNGVRLAHASLDNARARIEEYRSRLIPRRIEAVARAQEEVNFMLIGIFELIALKQDEYDAYQGYLEAIRDYWLARVDLSLAAGMALPSSAHMPDERIHVDEFVRPASGGMDHFMHRMPTKESGNSNSDEHNHGGSQ